MVAPSRRGSTFALLRRVARAAVEEVDQIVPMKTIAEMSSRLLPEQTFNRTRTAALRAAGVRIGAHSLIMGPVRITGAPNPCKLLSIGEWTMVNGPLHVDLGAPVSIGSSVRFGHNVSLLTVSHDIGEPHLRAGTHRALPVRIGDGVWIASGVIILPGVTVGESSIVAAGSVVTRDVPPNSMVAGVPARVVRSLANGAETDGVPDSRSWSTSGRVEQA